MSIETFTQDALTIQVIDDEEAVVVAWSGQSVAREPSLFVLPILHKAIQRGEASERGVVLDFRSLDYLNSSTITPVIRVLERSKRGSTRLTILYDDSLKWQSLSFSALQLFGTPDGRIAIEAH